MESLLEKLNPAQQEAATCTDRHLRIVAGAGSGKTTVLMARIEYLLNELGIEPDRILAITFTNKAAREMKERLLKQVPDQADRVRISTIHAFCARMLREDAPSLGYPRDFRILDAEDQKAIIRKALKKLSLSPKDYKPAAILGMISNRKTKGVTWQQAIDQAKSRTMMDEAEIYREYMQAKDEMKAMDFDDLLIKADALLKTDPRVRTKWQNRLDYLHVDEFQDVDPIQYSIIRQLVRDDAILAVVGDPDQTIYTWRGASIDIILNFEKDFQPSRTILLRENYRSSAPILQASNALIKNNRSRVEKELFTSKEGGSLIEFFSAPDEPSEAAFVSLTIKDLHAKGEAYDEMAVLYRSNYLSMPIEQELTKKNIPYRIVGGIRFFERAEIKDMLSYLQLIAPASLEDPENRALDLAVERVANVPARGLGPKFFELLNAESRERDLNLYEIMKDPQTLSSAQKSKALAFSSLIEGLKKELEENSLPDMIDRILKATGYQAMLKEKNEEGRLDNIEQFKSDIERAVQENPSLTLNDYLASVSLYTAADENEKEDAVTLMTVHAAKGTEFDNVFIVGASEGVFPSERSVIESGPAGLEEERRLMYVAMTRARKNLYISWNSGYSFQTRASKSASRFLQEIPDEAIKGRKEEKNKPSKTVTASRFNKPKTLNSMRTDAKALKAIRPGSEVHHPKFGDGVVIAASQDVITVAFAQVGTKKIARRFLELKA